MKILEKSQEKQPIEDEIASHQFRKSLSRSCEEQDNFMMRNQKKGKLFEQDDDVTKKVHLKVVEFYGKLNLTLPFNFYRWLSNSMKLILNITPP